MHGGLFSKDDVSLKDIRAVDRVKQPPEDGLMSEILWSDPQPQNGRSESKRGVGKCPRAPVQLVLIEFAQACNSDLT